MLALIGPAAATAQVLTTIEFSFSNPGARSLGFGGAFVALADDATAAFANPAGLVQLSRPEVSLEGRFWSYSSPYTAGGRAAGDPTGLGIDTVADPIRVSSRADLAGFSFVSVVYPKGRWSFAVYRHQLQNFEMTQEIQGIFTSGPVAGAWRGPIERGSFDFKVITQAAAVGYRLGDRLSIGAGLSHFQPHSAFTGLEYLPDEDTLEAYFAPASFLPGRLSHAVEVASTGSDLGLAVGFLWKPEPRWSVGGAYREGPAFEFRGEAVAGPAHPEVAAGTRLVWRLGPWSYPDVYSLGVAYRSKSGRWTGSCEWSRVEYSTIVDSFDPQLSTPGDILEDADELHLGGEYAFFLGSSVMAVRFGAWRDPDHQVRNETGGGVIQAENLGGADELHVTGGFGLALDKLQIDFGIDLSELRDTASLSLIYSF
ncbi:MAG: OmpP1/FadL family transporter [Thermoanaerobaculia bacterium]